MNDIQLAGGLAGLAALLLIAAAIRSGHDRQYRVLTAVGLALLAGMFALVMYDLGQIVDAFQQFGTDLQEEFPTEP
jgi:hypothetical protein